MWMWGTDWGLVDKADGVFGGSGGNGGGCQAVGIGRIRKIGCVVSLCRFFPVAFLSPACT